MLKFNKLKEGVLIVYEHVSGYLKNHCTKHMLVCTHFGIFSILIQIPYLTITNIL